MSVTEKDASTDGRARVTMSLAYKGVDYEAEIAKVESTRLGLEHHGIFTASITFTSSSGSWAQSNDGMILDTYDKAQDKRIGTAFGLDHVMAVTRTLGVDHWEGVKGLRCLVLRQRAFGQIVGIADLGGERVLIFKEHAAQWYPEVSS